MRNLLRLMARLLLPAAVALAAMPVVAREMVCVIGRDEAVVPMAKCGMACCPMQAPKADCCQKKQGIVPKQAASRYAGMPCRCEVRIVGLPSLPSSFQTPTAPAFPHPAILPSATVVGPKIEQAILDPGIVGVDSGPPRKRPRSPQQTRAPPVSF